MNVAYERDPLVGDGYCAFRGTVQDAPFTGLHFAQIIRLVGSVISVNDDTVIFTRTDKAGVSFQMDPSLVQVLKTNVEEAVVRVLRDSLDRREGLADNAHAQVASPLRAGSTTMASAFGEDVLIRRRNNQVECPFCGRWAEVHNECTVCYCTHATRVVHLDSRWSLVRVEDLLRADASFFFLPREWNQEGVWASRTKLRQLLTQLKEKTC